MTAPLAPRGADVLSRPADSPAPETDAPRRRRWTVAVTPDFALRVAVLGIGAVLVWRLSQALLLLFLAVLIATVLRGIADALARWLRLPEWLALTLVAIALAGGGCAAAYWIGPAVTEQADKLVSELSGQWQHLRSQYGHTAIGHALASGAKNPQALESRFSSYLFGIAGSAVGMVGAFFVVVVTSLYLAGAAGMYLSGAVRLVPIARRPLARRVAEEMAHDLRRWLLGQLADMIAVGCLAAIGLYLLGVPVPFALATLAGLLTIVPYFGALAAAVPGVLVGLTKGWETALWVIVVFAVCHAVEGYVVAPLVQHRTVRMPPVVVIMSMTFGVTLFGPLGIVLGTPLAVVALVLIRRVYVEHVLGDTTEVAP